MRVEPLILNILPFRFWGSSDLWVSHLQTLLCCFWCSSRIYGGIKRLLTTEATCVFVRQVQREATVILTICVPAFFRGLICVLTESECEWMVCVIWVLHRISGCQRKHRLTCCSDLFSLEIVFLITNYLGSQRRLHSVMMVRLTPLSSSSL